jgi:hypothetical protein
LLVGFILGVANATVDRAGGEKNYRPTTYVRFHMRRKAGVSESKDQRTTVSIHDSLDCRVFDLEKRVCCLEEERELGVGNYDSWLKRNNAELRPKPVPVHEELGASVVIKRTIPENVPACLFCVILRVARTKCVFVNVEARVVAAIPPVPGPNLNCSGRPSTVHAEEFLVLLWYRYVRFASVHRVTCVVHGRGGPACDHVHQ